jgi:hypothetical protein
MRNARRLVGCGLTSAAIWMLPLSADAHAQRANATVGHLRGAKWTTSAVAIGGRQEAPAPARRDSLLNGVLIGAGVGALAGLVPDHYDDCEECHDSLYASIAVGAGVGLLVDALRVKSAASPQSGLQTSLHLGMSTRSTRLRVAGILRWR